MHTHLFLKFMQGWLDQNKTWENVITTTKMALIKMLYTTEKHNYRRWGTGWVQPKSN